MDDTCMTTRPWQIISSSTLKLIAVVTMFIDHFGLAIVYWSWDTDIARHYQLCRDIGRIAFPIYCFLLVEGFFYTRSRLRYAAGLLAIWGMEKVRERHILLMVLPAAAGMGAAYLLHTDYDFKGVLLIVILYLFRTRPVLRFICGALCLTWEWKAIFAWIWITLYNGERGWMKGPVIKYAFYIFYPAHLLLLAYLRYRLFRI